MTTPTVISFRDADQPRALATRFIAVATRHPAAGAWISTTALW